MGDEQRNKDIVRTVEQLWIDEKLDQLDQYFAPNDHSHDRPPFLPQGLAGAKIAHQGSMKSFKDRDQGSLRGRRQGVRPQHVQRAIHGRRPRHRGA